MIWNLFRPTNNIVIKSQSSEEEPVLAVDTYERVLTPSEEDDVIKHSEGYLNNDNEIYLALTGGRVGNYWWALGNWGATGSPTRVSFDHELIMKREDEVGDVIGFFHTHPNFDSSPSHIDYTTMAGWTLSFGRPLACLIEGIDGLKGHWFIDEETPHVTTEVTRVGNFFSGIIPFEAR